MNTINYRAKTKTEIRLLTCNRILKSKKMLDKWICSGFFFIEILYTHGYKECTTELSLNTKSDIGSSRD